MRRVALVLTALSALLTLAGCGGRSPAEEAYLAELQERSSMIELPDPDGALEEGRLACGVLADTKPEERYTTAAILTQSGRYGITYSTLDAAVTHLCPELSDALEYTG